MRLQGEITYPKLLLLESQYDEHFLLGREKEINEFIADLSFMSPLIAHIRLITILGGRVTEFAKAFYKWHCELRGREYKEYNAKQYKVLLSRKRIKALKDSNWGKVMLTTVHTVQVSDGEKEFLTQIEAERELTIEEIQARLNKTPIVNTNEEGEQTITRLKVLNILRVKNEQ